VSMVANHHLVDGDRSWNRQIIQQCSPRGAKMHSLKRRCRAEKRGSAGFIDEDSALQFVLSIFLPWYLLISIIVCVSSVSKNF
jgi:hypothetical protein